MNSEYTKISLSYRVAGEWLVKAGRYSTAKVKVQNAFTKNEKVLELESSKQISKPEYKYAEQRVNLGQEFVNWAMKRPEEPKGKNIHQWLRTVEGKLFSDWGKLSPKQRIERRVEEYVSLMGGDLRHYSFELM